MSSVTTATPAVPFVERRRRRGLRLAWRIAFTLMFGAWSLLLLAWLVLHWGIVPRLGQWKPEIEARASAALGVPVSIGALRVQSRGWMPLIEIDDVVLAPREGAGEALRLPRVHAALSARSLLGLELRFEQLHVDGAALEVRRDAQGRLFVAGIEVRAGTERDDADGSGTEWLLAQHEIAVRNGRVRWLDEQQPGAAPLELSAVDVVLRNGIARHDIRLDATPPAAAGERFTVVGRFTQPLFARRGDWRQWSGSAYAHLPRAESRALQDVLRTLPLGGTRVESGEGALRAWVDVQDGQPRQARADLALRDVVLRFAGREQPLPVARLQTRLQGERHDGQWRLAAEGLSFASGAIDWPASRVALALRESPAVVAAPGAASAPAFAGGEFSADRIDLAALAALAGQLPLGDAVHQLLATLAPSGELTQVLARWDGALDAPRRYALKGRAKGMSIAAAPAAQAGHIGRPGWRNAELELDASETGGQARLALNRGALILPGVFEQPELGFDQFASRLAWRITPRGEGKPAAIEVNLTETKFANADVQGQFDVAQWRTGDGPAFERGGRFPGHLELSGQLSRGRAAAVARYLPLGVPEPARRYVQRAVVDGKVAGASFKVKGDLWDFPFVAPLGATAPTPAAGEFRIAGRIEDVTLNYVPADPGTAQEWPGFTRVAGELIFDRGAMEIRDAQARLWGLALVKVNGGIRELRQPVLKIEGQASGPAGDLLRYVNSSPMGGWIGDSLREASASANGELKLALELPFEALERSVVQGTVQLPGNDIRLAAGTPLMAGTKGRVSFTRQGLTVSGASARVLGGEASFEGGTQADGSLRFNGQGVITAEGLRGANELGASVARLFARASGQTPYRLSLGFVRGRPDFVLTSPLTGLALDLPAPLTKPAEAAWPLRIETRVAPDGPLRDSLRVELGTVLQAQYQREWTSAAGAPPRAQVLRGAIGVFEPTPTLPERGVQAVLALGAIDGDAWERVVDGLQAPAAGAVAGGDEGYLPHVVALRSQSLVMDGRRLSNLVLGVSQDPADGTWRGSLDADQLGGYVEYRAARGAASPGRIYARLARLTLPPAEASSVENLLAEVPASVPALDIVIDQFELRGKKFGRVEIEAQHRGPRENREWRMNRFAVTTPEAQLSGSGQWLPAGGTRRMVMDFKLDLADSGAFLNRMGFADTLRGGKGRISGQLSWAGSPLAFHVPSLDGKLNLAIDAGQFLKAGPGAARLFSVLSLQSLPRRLVLDFRDVFQEGFAFDNITGEVNIDDGVAATRNLRMRGVQAAVLMEGSADLQRETQNLRVIVVPEINAGTASLAYAAINPAIGLGTFLAQLVLRRPLIAASTREFSVQGSWDDPKIERVERKFDAPVPDLQDPPAPAPTASAPKAAS